ncbi:MAG: HEAT repeat domain-containing protein [Planctomycetota bacterium JB042]
MRTSACACLLLLVPSLLARAQERPTAPIGAGRLRPSHEQYLDEVARGFSDPDPERRWEAIRRIARAGDAATPVVIERLRETRNPLGQRSALFALGEIGTETALGELERATEGGALKEDERSVAMLVLGARGRAAAVPSLREAASARRATLLGRAATLALGRVGDVEGLRPLVERTAREPIADRRVAIVTAAGATADRRLLPSIVGAIGDDVAAVRRAAAFAIGEIAEAAELELLLVHARREPDEEARAAFALAFGRIDHPSALEALRRATRDGADGVRDAAWAALAARPDGAADVAAALGAQRNAERRAALARAAAAGRGEVLEAALRENLSDRKAKVRSAAGRALAAMRADGEPQVLLDWLARESDEEARHDAALVAGVLRLPGALDVLAARPVDASIGRRVERVLRGRLDPRVLDEELERRLREEGGRLEDRRDEELDRLVSRVLDLDEVVRRRSGSDGVPPGPVPPGGKPRVDRRTSSVERDLIEWFDVRPYFPPSAERSRAR